MAQFAIRAEGIGKHYRLDRVESGYRQIGRFLRKQERKSLWALKDISFEVEEGCSFTFAERT